MRESRAAYQRREGELAQRRLEAVQGAQGAQSGEHRREISWWENTGLDGPVDAVHEESAEPVDQVDADSSESSNDKMSLTGSSITPSAEVSEEKDEARQESTEPAHEPSETKESST